MTLVEFLLARITEDEAVHPKFGFATNITLHRVECMEFSAVERSDATCDCDGPKRWLAECEAKRRIVTKATNPDLSEWEREGYTWILCELASVYADHPDF